MSALALRAPSPALACQCPNGPDGFVSWPADGATDVPTDTPIVVQLVDHLGDPGKIGISLEDEAGQEIRLNETERVPPAWRGCGAAEAVFLRPARNLEPGALYTVWFTPSGARQRGATFTVSDHSFEREPPITAVVTYAAHYLTRSCLDADCPALANIRVDVAGPPERPAWLFVESSADAHARHRWSFRPGDSDRSIVLNVMQGAEDRCVDVRILGVEGRALFEERVCQPSACAVCTIIAGSTCGYPSSCSTMTGCEEPDDAPADAGAAAEPGDASAMRTDSVEAADGGDSRDAGPGVRANRRRHPSCSALPDREHETNALAALALQLVAAAFTARVLRRRRGG